MEQVLIPQERINVVIGKKGETKKMLEEKGHVKIKINNDGKIEIEGDADKAYFMKDVIKAIGRGFNPNISLKLLKEGWMLEIINLKPIIKSKNDLVRIRGRVIGEKGKIKKEIEESTESNISVYGSTISIIAPIDEIGFAKRIIEKIVHGSRHSTILNELAKYRKEKIARKLLNL